MNSKIFRQYDGPWAKKPYPGKGYKVSGAGCGLVALTHAAIEQEAKKNWTPENLRKHMINKGYVTYGNGTTWNGMYQTMKYIGYSDTKWITEAMPMKDAFTELNKGNRIGIILFYGGYSKRKKKWYKTPDGTVWTGSGHYIFFGDYKYENGQHWFNLKDSGARKHDGWYSYEKSMKGCVGQLWIASRVSVQVTPKKATTSDGKLAIDGIGGVGTVKAMQKFLGCTQDGIISGQNANLKRYFPALKSVSFSDKPEGSATIKRLQLYLGISPDGILGKTTVEALQKDLGIKQDGVWGKETMKAWQKFLNDPVKKAKPTTTTPAKPATVAKVKTKGDKIADTAKSYVGKVKYVKGGTDIKKGVDCTGFVQECYRLNGISLTNKLSNWGKSIGKDASKAQPGDIFTFKNKAGIHHGIYIGNGKICHASSSHKDYKKDVIISSYKSISKPLVGIRRRWK